MVSWSSVGRREAYGGSTWSSVVAGTANTGTYPWVVTAPTSTQCRVRVTSVTYPSVSGISNANFRIAVPALVDFDGDWKTDIAFYRSSNGGWYIVLSSNPSVPYLVGWGGDPTDVPVITNPGTYM